MSTLATSAVPVRSYRLKQIVLPTEHGGWGFLFEPIVAGLAVAFTPAAAWISLMMIGAFLTRQPLKVLIADRIGTQMPGRGIAAFGFVALFGSLFASGLAGALASGGTRPMLPFLFVLPFVPLQIYSDVYRKSRQLLPELTGAVSISSSIAAMALAGGMSWPSALALWAIFVCRLAPSIIYVRQRLLLEKGKENSAVLPVIAHIAALFITAVLAFNGLIPYLTVIAMLLLLYRAAEGLSAGRKKLKAMKIGIREVIYGAVTVISIIVGHYAGL